MSKVQEHWKNKEVLALECYVENDDLVTIMDFYRVSDSGKIRYYAYPICDTTISSIEHYNDDIWNQIEIHPNSIKQRNAIYYCGEGEMGNEGFIACTDESNNLKWSIFCTLSNPFIKMYFEKEKLVVESTSGVKFHIDIQNPKYLKLSVTQDAY